MAGVKGTKWTETNDGCMPKGWHYEGFYHMCRKFCKSYKEFKKDGIGKDFDEVEMLHYLNSIKLGIKLLEEEYGNDERVKRAFK